MTCTAVTRRASEEHCQHNFHDGRSAPCGHPENEHLTWAIWLDRDEPDIYGDDDWHAYLGPVVERCGHPESEHGTDGIDREYCDRCSYDAEFHAYTEEPVAQSQERMG